MPCSPCFLPYVLPLRLPFTGPPTPAVERLTGGAANAGPGLWWLVSGHGHVPIVQLQLSFGGRLLTARWLGNSTPENLLRGAQQVVKLVGRYHVPVVLSDGSQSSGDWSDVLPLIEYEVLPSLVGLGLRGLALVSSSFAPSQMALHELARTARAHPIATGLFDTLPPAQRWVMELLTEA